jgi:hypothetical protein
MKWLRLILLLLFLPCLSLWNYRSHGFLCTLESPGEVFVHVGGLPASQIS